MRDLVLAQVPAKEDHVTRNRMDGREVDESSVEVFHLNAEPVELGDELGEAPLGLLLRPHRTTHGARIEAAAVSRHLGLQRRDTLRGGELVPPRGDESLDQRPHDRQRLVRLLLCE